VLYVRGTFLFEKGNCNLYNECGRIMYVFDYVRVCAGVCLLERARELVYVFNLLNNVFFHYI